MGAVDSQSRSHTVVESAAPADPAGPPLLVSVETLAAWLSRSKSTMPAVEAYGFTASTSARSLASTFGMTWATDP